MTKPFLNEPVRWSDQTSESERQSESQRTDAERAVGVLLGRVREATEPSPVALQRLSARRNLPARAGNGHRVLRVAIVTVVTGGAVGVAVASWRHIDVAGILGLRRVATVDPADVKSHRASPAQHGLRGRAAVNDLVRGTATPAPVEADVAASAASLGPDSPPALSAVPPAGTIAPTPPIGKAAAPASPAAGARTVAPPAPATESSEAGILARVFRDLRSGGDSTAVLRALDAYDQRFPDGTLRGEGGIARPRRWWPPAAGQKRCLSWKPSRPVAER